LHLQNHLLRIINLDQGDYRIRITDITGRVVMVEDFTAGQSVNVPVSLKTGIYIVEIASENHIYTNKLYVQ
ncbi:MAG: T9SS type A sorting domain-containing protein, partial [Bacteroidota bacterium]